MKTKKNKVEKRKKPRWEPEDVEFDFSDVKQRLKYSRYGTGWLTVYGKIWAFMMVVVATITVMVSCFQEEGYYGLMKGDSPLSHKVVLTLALLSILVIVALVAYLNSGFKRLTLRCFFWNKVFLILYPVPYAFGKALSQANQYGGEIWFYTLSFALSAGLFSLFNFIYFERRKYLFDETLTAGKIDIRIPVLKDMAVTLAVIVLATVICYLAFK